LRRGRFDPCTGALDPRNRRRQPIIAHGIKGYASGDCSASEKARVLTDRAADDK
jgi:hypothetical protein